MVFSKGNEVGSEFRFQKGHTARLDSGFYYDGFYPCTKENCGKFEKCALKETAKDEEGDFVCAKEVNFFNQRKAEIEKAFNLDDKDNWQLPSMIMIMIQLKRFYAHIAHKGITRTSFIFNPKTGEKFPVEVPNLEIREAYYAQKTLREWLNELKFSRSSRDDSGKVDILMKIINSSPEDDEEDEVPQSKGG